MSGSFLILLNYFFLFITIISAAIVFLDICFFKQRKSAREMDGYIRYGYELAPLLIIIMIVRTYIFEPFIIPSESMYPGLTKGDVVLVNKTSYGLKFPYTNVNLAQLNDVERGDVAVFQYPLEPNTFFIKRVIGVPGDVMRWSGDDLYINGVKIIRSPMTENSSQVFRKDYEELGSTRYVIQRLNGVESDRFNTTSPYLVFKTMNDLKSMGVDVSQKFDYLELRVPAGFYLAMGDNRDQSSDGRVWGLVPQDNFVGRADYLAVHFTPDIPSWKVWEKVSFKRTSKIH